MSNASGLTDEDMLLYENNNICMQSEIVKKIGMTNYMKSQIDMNNESIESFDENHAVSVNERFEKTIKKRVMTNIESQDTIKYAYKGLNKSLMSDRVNEAYLIRKQLKQNNEKLKYNNLKLLKGPCKTRRTRGTSLQSGSRLNRTQEEESNADDLTKEYLSQGRESRTRNLDQRAAQSAIDEEYQQFLR